MSRLQVLCATMHQTDFSKIAEMNIHSDVIFANQADRTELAECSFGHYTAKTVTTSTRGVGINRNLLLSYADAEICLMADDDVCYNDGYAETVLAAFDRHPNADIIVFNLTSGSPERRICQNRKRRWLTKWTPNPFGGPRIAFRLSAVRKCNLWFTAMFGGGAPFPSGEDSLFLQDALKRGLKIFCETDVIGSVDVSKSTWFTGFDKKMYLGKGAYYAAVHPRSQALWRLYFALRSHKAATVSFADRLRYMRQGAKLFANYKIGMTLHEEIDHCQ